MNFIFILSLPVNIQGSEPYFGNFVCVCVCVCVCIYINQKKKKKKKVDSHSDN